MRTERARRGVRRPTVFLGMLGLALAIAPPADAQVTPYGSVEYLHDSNVFGVADEAEAITQTGGARQDDSTVRYAAGVDAGLDLGLQRLRLAGRIGRTEYSYFQQLDHDESFIDGGLDWKLASRVDGTLGYRREKRLATLADLRGADLRLQTDQTGEVGVNVNLAPDWRVEMDAEDYRSALPLDAAPGFRLQERRGSVALKYAGRGRVTTGVLGSYARGTYDGIDADRRYRQHAVEMTVDAQVGGFHELLLRGGFVKRAEDATVSDRGDSEGFTGSLTLSRRVGDGARLGATLFRRVDSYDVAANTLIDTGGQLGLRWQATPKMLINARIEWLESEFSGGDPVNAGREDRMGTAAVDVMYQALRWLSVRPFAEYVDRESTQATSGYRSSVLGVELKANLD